jgi:RNA polymerase sigma factor (sigma-70 family)
MSGTVAARPDPRGAETDEGLAARAVAGDGGAFAELYERYEQRAFNLCYRITGSRDDAADATQEAFVSVLRRLPKLQGRELDFGSYLLTAARNACYDLIARRRRAEPSDDIPESAAPVGSGGGPSAPDPGDPGDDPLRNLMLEASQDEIRRANAELPERHREVLALRELEELSYDEIAEIMDMNRNSVAQLISRARINLRDALRGTALASIAAAASECERALPLIAARQDGQLQGADEAAWLQAHLAGCQTCPLSLEAMEEAGASYRAWAPIAAAPWLLQETMARAAEAMGADWDAVIEARRGGARRVPRWPARRRLTLAGGLALTMLVLLLAAARAGDDEPRLAKVTPVAARTLPSRLPAAPTRAPARERPAHQDAGDAAAPERDASRVVAGAVGAGRSPSRPRGGRRRARSRRTSPRAQPPRPPRTNPVDAPEPPAPATPPAPSPPVVTTPPEPPPPPPPERCHRPGSAAPIACP